MKNKQLKIALPNLLALNGDDTVQQWEEQNILNVYIHKKDRWREKSSNEIKITNKTAKIYLF